MTRTPMSWGAQVSKSAVFQGRLDGKAPIMMTPQSMPIIAESSYAFSADAKLLPDWKRRIAVSPLIMLSAWPRPIRRRPSTRIGNPPPLVRQSAPIASTSGPSHIARRRWWVRKSPSGTSATMRAKPNAPATRPSCQSASAALRAMAGRTAGKAPPEKMLEKVITQSRAVRDVTRPLWICPIFPVSLALARALGRCLVGGGRCESFLGLVGRQVDSKRRAPGWAVLDQEATVVGLHDCPTDRQPHAQAVGSRGEERLEDPIEVGLGDALARVVHAELDIGCGRNGCPHGDFPVRDSSVRGGGDGIREQVQEHLLDLHRVAMDNGLLGRREEIEGYRMQ